MLTLKLFDKQKQKKGKTFLRCRLFHWPLWTPGFGLVGLFRPFTGTVVSIDEIRVPRLKVNPY